MKNKSNKIAGVILAIIAVLIIAAIIIGTLATPLVLAVTYSWYWMFLYPIYFVLAFLAFAWLLIKYGFLLSGDATQKKE